MYGVIQSEMSFTFYETSTLKKYSHVTTNKQTDRHKRKKNKQTLCSVNRASLLSSLIKCKYSNCKIVN